MTARAGKQWLSERSTLNYTAGREQVVVVLEKGNIMAPVKNQVEALLFSSGKAMEEEQLSNLTGTDKKAVKKALKELQSEYDTRDTALKIFNEGTTWKILVHDEHVPLVRKIVADTEISRATMETLAIIAYHQPKVLQSKVVDLRGGNAYDHIAELEELGFIVKSKEGRSFSIKLTEKFYEYFDVEGEKGIRQVFKAVQQPVPKEQQKRLGELAVVPIPQEKKTKKGKLGDLEVVDEPEEPHDSVVIEEDSNGVAPTAKLERNVEAENSFLSKLDKQIEEISRRNDEVAKDQLFKVPEPVVPEIAEQTEPTAPENSLEPAPEPVVEPVVLSEPVSAPEKPKKSRARKTV